MERTSAISYHVWMARIGSTGFPTVYRVIKNSTLFGRRNRLFHITFKGDRRSCFEDAVLRQICSTVVFSCPEKRSGWCGTSRPCIPGGKSDRRQRSGKPCHVVGFGKFSCAESLTFMHFMQVSMQISMPILTSLDLAVGEFGADVS